MPRLTNKVPQYRKHRASGQAIVKIAGRMHYLGPHGTKASKIEYDRLIAEWLVAGRSLSFAEPEAELSIAELLASYLRHAKAYYGGGTRGEYANMRLAAAPLKRLYSRTAAANFGPKQHKTVRQTLLAADHSRTHINATMKRIVRIFRWGAAEGMIPAAVPQNLAIIPGLREGRTEARETDPVELVPDTVVEATLPYLSEMISDMVRLQRLVGCRPAEVCLIRPIDVDMSGDVWRYQPESHKTKHPGKERFVFLGPQAQEILRKYLLRPEERYCFSPQDSERRRRAELTANRKTPRSCGNTVGSNRKQNPKRQPRERYDTGSYRQAIHRGCDKAGIERWSPNRLRHSTGSEVRKQFGLEAAQVTLGHAKADTTQIYAERDHTLAASVARQIG
jgi:integrase